MFNKDSGQVRVTGNLKTRRESVQMLLSYYASNFQIMGAREQQEDSFALVNAMDVTEVIRNGLFAVVADGMGGMEDGRLVSEMAVAELVELFRGLDRRSSLPNQLFEGIYRTNRHIYECFRGTGGTTAAAVMFYDSALYWISVGDSSIYLRRDGKLFLLNQRHSYLNQLYLAALHLDKINREQIEQNKDAPRLSGFLGIDVLKKIDFNRRPLQLQAGDMLFLCTDGVSGTLSEEEMNMILALEPAVVCSELQKALERKARPNQDNATGVIVACCE